MYATALIAKLLQNCKKSLYVYPGGTIAPIFHECKAIGVPLICGKTEQGTGFMAIADAALSGTPSFAAVTSGPGATNFITPLAEAWFDSYPLICFTGQVGIKDLDRAASLRQRGFQETPIQAMVGPITKAVFQPRNTHQLQEMLLAAWRICQEGRPGPVLIDLPMNVQMEVIDPQVLADFSIPGPPISAQGEQPKRLFAQIREALENASRPLLLLGAGALSARNEVRQLGTWLSVPVVSSMRGIGIFATTDPLWQGWIGHTGFPWANAALAEADVVLVLGSRLDLRQTGTQTGSFDNKTIIHIDIDPEELTHCRIKQVLTLCTSVSRFISAFMAAVRSDWPDWTPWKHRLVEMKRTMLLSDQGTETGVAPDSLLQYIDRLTQQQDRTVVTGVGSHQQWAARYFSADLPNQRLLTSAGHGTMGFALPVALGVKRLQPESLVLVVDGDGSFQMNIQELALIREFDLDIKILVMDNNRLGIVSQFQQITFKDDPVTGSFYNPDFTSIARAYGLAAWNMNSFDEETIRLWLEHPGAALLHVQIQHDAPVSPMLLAGQELGDMWYR